MAWIIGDSFDFYTTFSDASTGFWDLSGSMFLASGRFAGSQGVTIGSGGSGVCLSKASGSNDATHHFVIAFISTTLGAQGAGLYIQLLDGAAGQCCVVFRNDGAILLTSNISSGTTLATYTGAFSQNVWTAFEFEITINSTTGAFHVRKEGNTSDNFSATGLNTQTTANAYANKAVIAAAQSFIPHVFDDFLWFSTSGAVPNTWVGDVRAVQLMPIADTSTKQFTPGGTGLIQTTMSSSSQSGNQSCVANTMTLTSLLAVTSGTVTSFNIGVRLSLTGHFVAAIYDATGSGGGPGALLGQSVAVTNPTAGLGLIAAASGSPAVVAKGVTYWIGVLSDGAFNSWGPGNLSVATLTQTYASGPPSSMSGFTLTANSGLGNWGIVVTNSNSQSVLELHTDGDTSYVFDSTVGHNDLYDVAHLATTPLRVIGVQTRAFARKSDAGARAAQVQLKSGATTVSSTPFFLASSYQQISRIDTVDPNTSAAWTGTAINAIQIGPVVQA